MINPNSSKSQSACHYEAWNRTHHYMVKSQVTEYYTCLPPGDWDKKNEKKNENFV